jgi:hypothetical protein
VHNHAQRVRAAQRVPVAQVGAKQAEVSVEVSQQLVVRLQTATMHITVTVSNLHNSHGWAKQAEVSVQVSQQLVVRLQTAGMHVTLRVSNKLNGLNRARQAEVGMGRSHAYDQV